MLKINKRTEMKTVVEPEGSTESSNPVDSSIPIAMPLTRFSPCLLALCLVTMGCTTGAILLALGLINERNQATAQFQRTSQNLLERLEQSFKAYEVTTMWIHESYDNEFTYSEGENVIAYIKASGLNVDQLGVILNITEEERPTFENETLQFINENFPHAVSEYKGFHSCNATNDIRDYYLVTHYMAPMQCEPGGSRDECGIGMLDLDARSLPEERDALERAQATRLPSVTSRLPLYRGDWCQRDETGVDKSLTNTDHNQRKSSYNESSGSFIRRRTQWKGRTLFDDASDENYALYAVKIMNPGVVLDGETSQGYYSFAQIDIPEVLQNVHETFSRDHVLSIYIYDITDLDRPQFLGGADLGPHAVEAHDSTHGLTLEPEKHYSDVTSEYHHTLFLDFTFGQRDWRLISAAPDESFHEDTEYVIITAVLIVVISLGLALFVITTVRKQEKIRLIQSTAEHEKTALMIENANQTAQKEREMNEYISHEVRNPLSAAMSACAFVRSTLKEKDIEAQRQVLTEDVDIIDNSLQFINDLLRNLLDWQRATYKQIKIEFSPVDIKRDVLEPVASMLYHRGHGIELQIQCPDNLVVLGDRLRLKQIVLNIGRNALKFVNSGFVRFRAGIVDGLVEIAVEDSGPGVPKEKHDKIFNKFQESLDSLCQGTGVGLALCQNLVDLMGGELSLDTSYSSEFDGRPGACFKILLPASLVDTADLLSSSQGNSQSRLTGDSICEFESTSSNNVLPENISALFVDDEIILRKLFSRTISRVAPTWKLDEAANGETALLMTASKPFDIIFLDQYMSSVDRQLLGTETARALRAQGFEGIICGLSANDLAQDFVDAGADSFLQKPIPGKREEVLALLRSILRSSRLSKTDEADGQQ